MAPPKTGCPVLSEKKSCNTVAVQSQQTSKVHQSKECIHLTISGSLDVQQSGSGCSFVSSAIVDSILVFVASTAISTIPGLMNNSNASQRALHCLRSITSQARLPFQNMTLVLFSMLSWLLISPKDLLHILLPCRSQLCTVCMTLAFFGQLQIIKVFRIQSRVNAVDKPLLSTQLSSRLSAS